MDQNMYIPDPFWRSSIMVWMNPVTTDLNEQIDAARPSGYRWAMTAEQSS